MFIKKFIYAVLDNTALTLTGRTGIGGRPLKRVLYKDISAIVSDLNEIDTGNEALKTSLLEYQQANAGLLHLSGQNGMLPLKFGFTAVSEQEVVAMLKKNYLQLRAQLKSLKGKAELVIQASWNLSAIIPQIYQTHPELINRNPLLTGQHLSDATNTKKHELIDAIHGQLSEVSCDFSDAPNTTEQMILNRNYLIEMAAETRFDAAMNELGERYDASLSFRYLGPLPAYNFVNIELNRSNFSLLEQARNILQLPVQASWEEIKAAYRRLLRAHQLNKKTVDPEAAERRRKIVAAYEIAKTYCQSCADFSSGKNEGIFDFTREEVEKTFMLD